MRFNFQLKILWVITTMFIWPVNLQVIYAQTASENQVKAVFLYNFTRFTTWPESDFNDSNELFVIGIIGNDPFGQSLEEAIKGETVGSHPIVLRHINDVHNVDDCKILFIGSDNEAYIKQVLAYTSGKSILTVNDNDVFSRSGGMVRFFTEKNRIKIEINVEEVKKANLEISSKLLSLAKIYVK